MIHANYHTHTFRCKHAEGDVHDYCRAAVRRGLSVLGFSDHAPLPDNRWASVRMEMAELPDYCDAIEAAREHFPQLTILKGLEVEYVPELVAFYQDTFLGEYEMDYLVGGAHWYPHEGDWPSLYGEPLDSARLGSYTDYLIESMESGLYAFIAHPDLFGNVYFVWDDTAKACSKSMLQAASALDLPLEINGYGMRKPMLNTPEGRRHKYPWLPFWELASTCDTPVIINSDAHHPDDVDGDMEEAMDIARRFDLRVVDTLVGNSPIQADST